MRHTIGFAVFACCLVSFAAAISSLNAARPSDACSLVKQAAFRKDAKGHAYLRSEKTRHILRQISVERPPRTSD
jgi:hypothetical protein